MIDPLLIYLRKCLGHPVCDHQLSYQSSLRTRPHPITTGTGGARFRYRLHISSVYAVNRVLFPMFHIGINELRASAPNIFKTFRRVGLTWPNRNPSRSRATMAVLSPTVRPLQPPPGSQARIGAQVDGVDLENLTGEFFVRISKFYNVTDNRR